MSFLKYRNALIDCTKPVDTSSVKGQSVVITGGAGGIGEQVVRAFVNAGAFVTFGDFNQASGAKIEADLAPNAKFVRCDVTSWEDQLNMFQTAMTASPSKTVDVVVANAGITGPDPIYFAEEGDEPQKPDFKILNVNQIGALYTFKLARFYFLRCPVGPGRDRCFVILSSLAGYVDNPGGVTYMASKFAVRAIMRCARRTTVMDGIRSCCLAPTFVETNLLSTAVQDYVKSRGVVFADPADAAGCIIKIASDAQINGRCFTIVPRDDFAPYGYYDLAVDDFEPGSKAEELQEELLRNNHRTAVNGKTQ